MTKNIKKPSREYLWKKPSVKRIGNAKDIVANVNQTGGGDSQFSVLLPSN